MNEDKSLLRIKRIEKCFSVCKVADYSMVRLEDEYCFLGKTDEENSLVCATEDVPENVTEREDGFMAFRIQGVLEFSMVGVLAGIASLLAEQEISIFVVSTYNTDYIMTKAEDYERALKALEEAGYGVA